jgi:hypothetical protein
VVIFLKAKNRSAKKYNMKKICQDSLGSFERLFPNASGACRRLNAVAATLSLPADKSGDRAVARTFKGHSMNGTESAFALKLEGMKRGGEILRFIFEGIRLKWGVDPNTGAAMHYKPDFFVLDRTLSWRCIEIKGHTWDRDIVRFKGCRAEWPEFQFEMWQRKGGQWKRLF